MISDNEAYIILNAMPGLGAVRLRQALKHYGSAKAILACSPHELLRQRFLTPTNYQAFLNFDQEQFLIEEVELLKKFQAKVVTLADPDYPERLRNIPGAPMILYYRGNISTINEVALSMVGSRQASIYGLTMANEFASRLAELNIILISGMARGIDTAVHRACLNGGCATVAVLGCGLTHIYPPENAELMDMIMRQGAVISEFPMRTPPVAKNFPRRNRIISGLSLGVIVIEAARNSGALITSHFALEQGREVFALPGSVHQKNSFGPHQLIQQGAKLVTCIDDILEELNVPIRNTQGHNQISQELDEGIEKTNDFKELSPQEKLVYQSMDSQAIYIDHIASTVKKPTGHIMNILLQLEIKDKIVRLPGQYYVRK